MAGDPLTGGGAYRSQGGGAMGGGDGTFPHRVHAVFESGNFAAMKKKLLEFNQELVEQNIEGGLNEVNVNQLTSVVATVTNDPSGSPAIFSNQAAVAFSLLDWPKDKMLPVLDLMRLLVRHQGGLKALISNPDGEEIVKKVLAHLDATESMSPLRMLALRFVCNIFPSPAKPFVYKHADTILKHVQDISANETSHKNLRAAHAALLLK